jgi:predicted nucleic acid-binding protein
MKAATTDARPGGHEYSAPQCPTESPSLLPSYSRCFEVNPAKDSVFFCTQNIAEFWNVATRPAERNGLGLSPEEALQEVSNIEKSLTLLPDVPAIYSAWKQIVAAHQVKGVKVYDARLVAIMNVYAVENVLTFNSADFERFGGIRAIHPSSVVP